MSPRRVRTILSKVNVQQDEFLDAAILPERKASSGALRMELATRNLNLAEAIAHESTVGETPSILYHEVDGRHGNFLPASYRRIRAAPDWQRRLLKHYSASNRVARSRDRVRRELDCANSSDALLMNIFCYPGITRRRPVCQLLGVQPGERPQFGVRTQTPCLDGLSDRTEIDMLLGHLLVEAKLTESNFQNARRDLVHRYLDFKQVFEVDELPASNDGYRHYQLIRGVLAAHHSSRSFLLLCDARRGDLADDWFRVVRAVRSCELRSRLAILTWQELAAALPPRLQEFLSTKYGIHPSG